MSRFAIHAVQDKSTDGVVATFSDYASAYLVMCVLNQLYDDFDFRVAPESESDRVHPEAQDLMAASHYYVSECEYLKGFSDRERCEICWLISRSLNSMFPAAYNAAELPF